MMRRSCWIYLLTLNYSHNWLVLSWRINVLTRYLILIVVYLAVIHRTVLIHLRRICRIEYWSMSCRWNVVGVGDHNTLHSSLSCCSSLFLSILDKETSSEEKQTHRYSDQDYNPRVHFTDKKIKAKPLQRLAR